MPLAPYLSRYWDAPDSWTLETHLEHDGYVGLRNALAIGPDEVISTVLDSGLRGRGGAGFPTGRKWGFIPQETGDDGVEGSGTESAAAAKPHYLVVNADESEPGTCKDIPVLMANPHVLLEGMMICMIAIGGNHGFIYLRGEVVHVYRRLLAAVREAREAGLLGTGLGPNGDYDLDITVHAGAGA